jgi:virginiamycin A acetyltransferase
MPTDSYHKVKNDKKGKYLLLAPYKSKVVLPSGEFIFFGKGSLPLIESVLFFKEPGNIPMQVGHYCEIGKNSRIIIGSDYCTQKPINNINALPFELQARACYQYKGTVVIGNNVVIGANVTILPGVTIGDGAIIGAGAVVAKDIPAFSVAAGNPAVVVKQRFEEAERLKILSIQWWNWKHEYLIRYFDDVQKGRVTLINPNMRDNENNYFILHYLENRLILSGACVDGETISRMDFPEKLHLVYEQFYNSFQEITLINNAFDTV